MSGPANPKWQQKIAELTDTITVALVNEGVGERKAPVLAEAALAALMDRFGGLQLYLPTGDRLRKQFRDRQIAREYDGKNIQVLVDKYQLSTVRIYKILEIQRNQQAAIQAPQPVENTAVY